MNERELARLANIMDKIEKDLHSIDISLGIISGQFIPQNEAENGGLYAENALK